MVRQIQTVAEVQAKAERMRRLGARKIYPLDAPGMPFPGPNFMDYAAGLGDDSEVEKVKGGKGKKGGVQLKVVGSKLDTLYRRATYEKGLTLPLWLSEVRKDYVQFIPGHRWAGGEFGPTPSRVMMVGKQLGREELKDGRHFVGPSSILLQDKLDAAGITTYGSWYVTNLLKYMPPRREIASDWVKDCLPILHQELRLVRPTYLLCLGADAGKAILGSKCTVTGMAGRVEEIEVPVYVHGEEPDFHKILVMVVPHPASVLRETGSERELELGLERWRQLIEGYRFDIEGEADVDHRVIDNEEDLAALIYEAEETCQDNLVAVDAEWNGQHPGEKNAYLRTIQFSWAHKKAACIVIRRQGGGEVCPGWDATVLKYLVPFFQGKRVAGHFFNSDLEFLIDYGLDLRPQFAVPTEPKGDLLAWERTREEGGVDTGILYHALEETGRFGLEHLGMRYTTAPRWDLPMESWKKEYCKTHGIKTGALEGYGDAPDSKLYPYSNFDADVTRRLAVAGLPRLDYDDYGNCCREVFWRHMAASPAALEIRRTGITLDIERVEELTEVFLAGRNRLERQVKKCFRWDDLNLRSVIQVRELLFGEKYNGKRDEQGNPIRVRPEGAQTLRLRPVLSSGQRQKPWEDIVHRGQESEHNPSTNKLVLGILQHETGEKGRKYVSLVRSHRFLDQALKSVLRVPEWDDDNSCLAEDDDGNLLYAGGLAAARCWDGRVRTFISQTKETGRWASSRPNLMAISKTRDADYSKILGDRYKHKLRSMLRASRLSDPAPWCREDCLLVEADYTGAELAVMAWLSNDPLMIDHVERSRDGHPNPYDIHSNIAVKGFKLTCAPSKKGLKDSGNEHRRNMAKAIIFGSAYGRSPKAIALAAREDGVDVSEDEAALLQDTIFAEYSGLPALFEACRKRVVSPGWMMSPLGSFRRFPKKIYDESMLNDLEREAMNFPIQATVAEAVSDAVRHLMWYRENSGDLDLFRIVLQIHDALLLEVPISKVSTVVKDVLPLCMQQMVPIYATDLDGQVLNPEPYYFSSEIDIYDHWGEKVSKERLQSLGVSL